MTDGAGPPEHEHAGCVLGMAFGLVLVLLLFVSLGRSLGGPVDAAATLHALMPDGAPAGYAVTRASRLPGGEVVLELARDADAGATGATPGPEDLVLVRFRSAAAAQRALQGGRPPGGASGGAPGGAPRPGKVEDPSRTWERWKESPDFAAHVPVAKGEVAWGTWRAPCATERSLRADGTWRDSVRVNLSQPKRFLVLFAQWPVGLESDPDALRPVLRTIAMAPASS